MYIPHTTWKRIHVHQRVLKQNPRQAKVHGPEKADAGGGKL